jgi:hypothetical protein
VSPRAWDFAALGGESGAVSGIEACCPDRLLTIDIDAPNGRGTVEVTVGWLLSSNCAVPKSESVGSKVPTRPFEQIHLAGPSALGHRCEKALNDGTATRRTGSEEERGEETIVNPKDDHPRDPRMRASRSSRQSVSLYFVDDVALTTSEPWQPGAELRWSVATSIL